MLLEPVGKIRVMGKSQIYGNLFERNRTIDQQVFARIAPASIQIPFGCHSHIPSK